MNESINIVRDEKVFTVTSLLGKGMESSSQLIQGEENLAQLEYFKGQTEMLNENYEKAIEHFDKVIQYNPNDVSSYNDMALCMIELGIEDGVCSYLDKAIKINPDFADTYYIKGLLLSRQRKHHEAIDFYQKVLALGHNKVIVYENLANAYLHLGDYNSALNTYQRAIELLRREENGIREEFLNRIAMIRAERA